MEKEKLVEEIFDSVAVEAIKALDEGKLLVECEKISRNGMSGSYKFFVYIDGHLHNVSRFLDFFYRLPYDVATFEEIVQYYRFHGFSKCPNTHWATISGCGIDRIESFLHRIIDVLIEAKVLNERKGYFNAKYSLFE